jgi:hypothetical protein
MPIISAAENRLVASSFLIGVAPFPFSVREEEGALHWTKAPLLPSRGGYERESPLTVIDNGLLFRKGVKDEEKSL